MSGLDPPLIQLYQMKTVSIHKLQTYMLRLKNIYVALTDFDKITSIITPIKCAPSEMLAKMSCHLDDVRSIQKSLHITYTDSKSHA
jgi:hypothetical protein